MSMVFVERVQSNTEGRRCAIQIYYHSRVPEWLGLLLLLLIAKTDAPIE